jgi:hypothetical protein
MNSGEIYTTINLCLVKLFRNESLLRLKTEFLMQDLKRST